MTGEFGDFQEVANLAKIRREGLFDQNLKIVCHIIQYNILINVLIKRD